MSQATANPHRHEPQARRGSGILAAAAAVIAILLLAFVLSYSPFAAEWPAAAPAAPLPASVSPDSSVPEASAVFAGRDMPIESLVATF